MNIDRLKQVLSEIKVDIERAICTASFTGRTYDNGREAKKSLICSSRLILKIRAIVKCCG